MKKLRAALKAPRQLSQIIHLADAFTDKKT